MTKDLEMKIVEFYEKKKEKTFGEPDYVLEARNTRGVLCEALLTHNFKYLPKDQQEIIVAWVQKEIDKIK